MTAPCHEDFRHKMRRDHFWFLTFSSVYFFHQRRKYYYEKLGNAFFWPLLIRSCNVHFQRCRQVGSSQTVELWMLSLFDIFELNPSISKHLHFWFGIVTVIIFRRLWNSSYEVSGGFDSVALTCGPSDTCQTNGVFF